LLVALGITISPNHEPGITKQPGVYRDSWNEHLQLI
jgi:hypothetical protein